MGAMPLGSLEQTNADNALGAVAAQGLHGGDIAFTTDASGRALCVHSVSAGINHARTAHPNATKHTAAPFAHAPNAVDGSRAEPADGVTNLKTASRACGRTSPH
eukprot:6193004-Pleurochrysis_carterae.AAC.7